MSIFITLLAFDNPDTINNSKIAIIVASVISATIGLTWLKLTLKN
jgi:NhaA family Na+:H+ antiporter